MDGAALKSASATVMEAERQLLGPARVPCCDSPDVQVGSYCGVHLDEPTCVACGAVAPHQTLLRRAAAAALAYGIACLRAEVGIGGTPQGEGDDVDLDDGASVANGSLRAGMDGRNTYICDGFLYSQPDQDVLEEAGRLRCAYCPNCCALYPSGTERCQRRRGGCSGAADADLECGGLIQPRRWVTNSIPLHQTLEIFLTLLPQSGGSGTELAGKTVVDVGSRLGNNLLCAALLTEARAAVGIEINSNIAALSTSVVLDSPWLRQAQEDLFEPAARTNLRVLCCDVRTDSALAELAAADVVILFNPFELHMSREEHATLLILMCGTQWIACVLLARLSCVLL
eukprot:COSAG02_NODE_8564_length_2522_cov_2087.716880_1_plen_342_part_00